MGNLLNKIKKIKSRFIDEIFIFKHAHLVRNIIESIEDDIIPGDERKENYIYISFRPTGGFGDYIISSKLLDEIKEMVPCKIDVFCENVEYGLAVYGKREDTNVLPINTFYSQMWKYDLALTVEHFVHIERQNPNKISRISPEFMDKLNSLDKGYRTYYPAIEQQWFRESMHFRRCELKGINRWSELRHGNVFKIEDQKTWIPLEEKYIDRIKELGLDSKTYITINRGADSMGRSKMQTKVWPLDYYVEFVKLFKKEFSDIHVIQIGAKSNIEVEGVDQCIFGESLETTKWILKKSLLHLDCEGGLVHLATQFDTKCVVIFGPTPKHFYGYPQNINLVYDGCNNCMGSHPDWAFECYRGFDKPECMYKITPKIVMSSVRDFLLVQR
ncbi:hypothetical protein LAD12857_37900 [Lacrimispora amygdalina]|uniref:Glycosyltransferase family 9 protein n=1 Tax=Lacrimispora amygdalina TaxID=253257 RepID=A0ABQ5MAM3_9FIRM